MKIQQKVFLFGAIGIGAGLWKWCSKMEVIKQEQINNLYGIVLMYFGREMGYEVAVSHKSYPNQWFETDGMYGRKATALSVYNIMKQEYASLGGNNGKM